MAERRHRLRLLLLGGAAGLLGVALFVLARGGPAPVGPEPVPYDRIACARCRMLVSEPRFAAQLRLAEGGTRFFDDPGCLLLWREEHREVAGRAFFHHRLEDAWIPEEEVAFVPVSEPTPMGYGLGAVRRGEEEGALSPAQARALLRERAAPREGGP